MSNKRKVKNICIEHKKNQVERFFLFGVSTINKFTKYFAVSKLIKMGLRCCSCSLISTCISRESTSIFQQLFIFIKYIYALAFNMRASTLEKQAHVDI